MQVVFLDRASLKAKVRKFSFAAQYIEHEKTAVGEIVPRLAQAAVAIINKVPMRAETLRQLPRLKMIAVAATGYDVVDIPQFLADQLIDNIELWVAGKPQHFTA
jgi:glycerate dehydrogenase